MTSPGGDNRNANVTLTANTQQYQTQMAASTQSTNAMSRAVDTLGQKLDGITKRAGKKLIHFAAGDFAALAGATATAATFEKQLSTLRATADVSGQSFKGYKASVESAFLKFPIARGQVIDLTNAITNMGVVSTRDVKNLTETFIKLGAATGESSTGLAQGLTQLSRMMGTTNAQQIGNFANSLLTVSKSAGVSSSGVLQFAQSIAPMARAAGIGEASVLGISTAFSKAGADGFVATNTFNAMASEITQLIQTGSPQLAKYANLIGVTNSQFKKLGTQEALLEIFETIGKQGPKAIQTLNNLGFEGIRAQSAIQAVAQSGNLRDSINKAVGSSTDQKNLTSASKAALHGLTDELTLLRNNFTQFGTEIGTTFLTPLTKVVGVLNTLFHAMTTLMRPFAPLIAGIGAIAGALAGIAGPALLAVGLFAKLASARWLLNSTPVVSTRAGYRAGQNPMGPYAASGGAVSRGFFNLGAGMGSMNAAGGPAGLVGRVAAAPLAFGRTLVNAQTTMMNEAGVLGPDRARSGFFPMARSAIAHPIEAVRGAQATSAEGAAYASAARGAGALGTTATAAAAKVAAKAAADAEGASATRILAREAGALVGAFARLGVATTKAGLGALAAGGAKVGGSIGRGIGSLGSTLASPLGLLIGIPLALQGISSIRKNDAAAYQVGGGNNAISKYDTLLKQSSTNLANFSTAVNKAATSLGGIGGGEPQTLRGVLTTPISRADISTATSGYKVTDSNFSKLAKSAKGNIGAAVSYIQTLGVEHGGMDAKTLGAIKSDLIATYGPDQAQKILDAYAKTGPAATAVSPNINYQTLGSALQGVSGKGGLDQAISGINAQSQVNPGQQSSRAQLAQLLQFGTGYLGGSQYKDYGRAQAFQGELQQIFGGNAKDYRLTQGRPGGGGPSAPDVAAQYATPAATQRQLLNALVNSPKGKAILKSIGMTPGGPNNQLTDEQISTILGTPVAPPRTSVQTQAIARGGALGQFATTNALISSVSGGGSEVGNPKAQFAAQEALVAKSMQLSGNLGDASVALQKLADTADNGVDPALQALAASARAEVRATQAYQLQSMSRGQQGTVLASNLRQSYREYQRTGTASSQQNYQQDLDAYRSYQESQRQYLIQTYQTVQAYNTQISRAYEDNALSIHRTERDFQIQMEHGQRDYNRSRLRQQRDFNIQLQQQAEQAAQSIYNPYQRVTAQYTNDAGTLLQNLQDQNERLSTQYHQLQQARRMGVSQQAIDVLDLSNANNSQQLNNLVQSLMDNPNLIRSINAAVATRAGATTELTQSQYSMTFRNTIDAFHRSFTDMATDFHTSQGDAVAAERQGLDDMAVNFRSMLDRSAADLRTAVTEINGSFRKLFPKVFDEVNGQLKKYAPEAAAIIQAALNSINLPPWITDPTKPNTTPGVLGRTAKGSIGSYDEKGIFHRYDSPRPIPEGTVLPLIAAKAQKKAIDDVTTAHVKLNDVRHASNGPVSYEIAQTDKNTKSTDSFGDSIGIATTKVDNLGQMIGRTNNHFDLVFKAHGEAATLKSMQNIQIGIDKTLLEAGGVSSREATAKARTDHGLKAHGRSIGAGIGFAAGGAVHGAGTETSDSIPAWLSKNEHIWTADEVKGAGGHRAVAAMRHKAKGYAKGGQVTEPDLDVDYKKMGVIAKLKRTLNLMASGAGLGGGIAGGGGWASLGSVIEFLHRVAGHPYVFGAVGPDAYDCSGLVGEVWARLTKHPSYHRYFSTSNEASFFEPGPGLFTVGIRDDGGGQGHTVGKLNGLKFEASDPSRPIMVGGAARDALTMPIVMHLKEAISTGIGSGVAGFGDAGNARGHLTPNQARSAGRSMMPRGWRFGDLDKVFTGESGWMWNANNRASGAYGIPQSLPGSKMASAGSDWHDNAITQLKWGLGYIRDRYGNPTNAEAHEQKYNWYDHGGVLAPGMTRAFNTSGQNEFVLTPKQLQAVHTAGLGTQATNVYKTYMDNSMTFKDIIVQASDPNAMARQLQQKARIARLSRPPRSTAGT